MHVIGTAGHVDHGKSTLIKAITGIDPDRLQEEKQRGMTIDLGFAWLTLPSGELVGIVDVPGHIDFIKNMLAGVGGIDLTLLVIAADEGVMPQTREHLHILDLLEVPVGLVAITKTDLAEDEEWLELVQMDVVETLENTRLADAEIVPVCATTGEGIDELLKQLTLLLAKSPSRADKGRPRLLIDRVFTVSGFGTVVTGTLIDGGFTVGQEVEILPQKRKARIRGMQTHQKSIEHAQAGSRLAINLTGVSTTDLHRGDVVTLPNWLEPSQLIDTYLRCLPDAARSLKHNQQVDIFAGATECSGYLRLLGTKQILPGEEGWVQLRLVKRIPIVKGDRFIIRQPSPSITIGGGVVVDPLPRRRHRRFRSELIERLVILANGTPEELILDKLDKSSPMQIRELAKQHSLSEHDFVQALKTLIQNETVFFIPKTPPQPSPSKEREQKKPPLAPPLLGDGKMWGVKSKTVIASKVGWQNISERLRGILLSYHKTNPLRVGMPHGELKSRLKLEMGLLNKVVHQVKEEGILETIEKLICLKGYKPQLTSSQQNTINALLQQFVQHPFTTPSTKECLNLLNNNEDLFNTVFETKTLIRATPDVLFLTSTFHEFADWLEKFITENGSITVAQVRDVFQTSRKYALALLEYADNQGITRRMGDERVLR